MGEDLTPKDFDPQDGDVDTQIVDSSHQVVDEGLELSAYEELGGGNPLERRKQYLITEIQVTAHKIETIYQPAQKGDKNIYKLIEGINVLSIISGYHQMERAVEGMLVAPKKQGSQTARNAAIRAHDSIGLVLNGFDFALPSGDIEMDSAKLWQFTQDHARSTHRFWSAPQYEELSKDLLRALSHAKELLEMRLGGGSRDVIERFITTTQLEFVKQGTGWKIPQRRTTAHANLEINLKKARKGAWDGLRKEAPSLLMSA